MERCVVVLKFTSPVHFGRRDFELDSTMFWAGSDQLFGAILSCFATLYGDAETAELLCEYERGGCPFITSSSFLIIESDRPAYFVPRPAGVHVDLAGVDAKKRKKIAYLPTDALEATTAGRELIGYQPEGVFLLPDWVDEPPICENEIPRVALDSISASSNLYYVSSVKFAHNAGLYFFLDYDMKWERKIKAAIRFLGDEGLGGERTYGFGHFTCEFRDAPTWRGEGDCRYLLSGYYPADDELELVRLGAIKSYRLRDTGGYIYSGGDTGVRKPWIKLFAEGAILAFAPKGKLIDITPIGFERHRVFRSGLAYTLAWNGGE